MKKLTTILLTIFTCFGFSSCTNNKDVKSDVIFSEIVEGSSNNRAIELFNLSDQTIELNNYKIEIQLVSGVKVVLLEGSIKSKETYTIVYDGADEILKEKGNLISSDLMFNGSQPIVLKKDDKIIDSLGVWDYQVDYCKDVSLVRKKEYLNGRTTFDEYDWIRYNLDNYKYLGTIEPSLTEQELLEGPKLTEVDYSRPYYIQNDKGELLGGGGVMNVTVKSYVDGDTTCFYYDEKILAAIGVSQGTKMRYQNINTPESYTGNIQPFGVKAKEYTKSRLSSAIDIKVQSILNGELTETFDRLLGWVWIDGELLNNSIVKMGYSNVAFNNVDNMLYKDVSYTSYLYNSELYAKKHGRGIHGEKDPYWDYDNNAPISNISGVNPNK